MKSTLTDAVVRNTPAPARGQIELRDASCRGLVLRITSTGVRAWDFRYTSDGRDERMTLGRYPDLALRDARLKADALRRSISEGHSPAEHRRDAPSRKFSVLAERYMDEHARRFKRSADADEAALNKHVLPLWANRDYTRIARADVIELVEGIIAAGTPIMANRVQALVSKVFSFALDASLIAAHPALRLRKRSPENVNERVLSDDEIRRFWSTCVQPPVSKHVGLALRLCLVLGCRAGEVAGMTRGELSDDGWTIPAYRTKNGRAHYLPLPALARDIIAEALQGGGDFVFPSRDGDGAIKGHVLTVAARRLGQGWRPHDLRRSCATRMGRAGVPEEDISAVLNHVRAGVTARHYALHDKAPEKRRALERWCVILANILRPQDNVTVLHG